jgi:hypothetical protein
MLEFRQISISKETRGSNDQITVVTRGLTPQILTHPAIYNIITDQVVFD